MAPLYDRRLHLGLALDGGKVRLLLVRLVLRSCNRSMPHRIRRGTR
jgi:hypothetical protein